MDGFNFSSAPGTSSGMGKMLFRMATKITTSKYFQQVCAKIHLIQRLLKILILKKDELETSKIHLHLEEKINNTEIFLLEFHHNGCCKVHMIFRL